MHWTWLVVAFLFYWVYTSNGGDAVTFVIMYGILFVIVTLHEFGHALACRSVGGEANTIVLWPLGGVAFVSPPVRPGAVLWSIAAGPLVNLVLIPVFAFLIFVATMVSSATGWQGVTNFAIWLFAINAFMFLFNMMPIYPLDGGQILQSVLWFWVGRARSTLIASWIGVGGGALMVLAALLLLLSDVPPLDPYLLLAVSIFILMQAYNGVRVARYLAAYERQGETMRTSWRPVHPHEINTRMRRIESVSRPVGESSN